jgi:hypothetical protein
MYVISFQEKTKRTMGVFLSIDSFITKKLILLNIIFFTIIKSKESSILGRLRKCSLQPSSGSPLVSKSLTIECKINKVSRIFDMAT